MVKVNTDVNFTVYIFILSEAYRKVFSVVWIPGHKNERNENR